MARFAIAVAVVTLTLSGCGAERAATPQAVREAALQHYYSGVTHEQAGRLDDAIDEHTRAIEVKPDFASAYSKRGDAYRLKGRHDRAVADYSEAIKLDPHHFRAYVGRAWIYEEVEGLHDRAIEDATRAIELTRTRQFVPSAWDAYLIRGIAYRKKAAVPPDRTLIERAIADLGRAIELKWAFAPAYTNRGAAYMVAGRYDEAIADYSTAIGLKPDAQSLLGRCVSYEGKGRFEDAARDCKEAIRLAPDSVFATLAKQTLERMGFY